MTWQRILAAVALMSAVACIPEVEFENEPSANIECGADVCRSWEACVYPYGCEFGPEECAGAPLTFQDASCEQIPQECDGLSDESCVAEELCQGASLEAPIEDRSIYCNNPDPSVSAEYPFDPADPVGPSLNFDRQCGDRVCEADQVCAHDGGLCPAAGPATHRCVLIPSQCRTPEQLSRRSRFVSCLGQLFCQSGVADFSQGDLTCAPQSANCG